MRTPSFYDLMFALYWYLSLMQKSVAWSFKQAVIKVYVFEVLEWYMIDMFVFWQGKGYDREKKQKEKARSEF